LRHETPTIQEIAKAHVLFEANEPRDLFYRAATELVDLSIRGATSLSVAEALAVLLQTWNAAFYRFARRKFDTQHFSDIEHVVNRHKEALLSFRQRAIEGLRKEDETGVKRAFQDFEEVLGPVGAAKCIHLLAPHFFPLWDRAIAQAYGLGLRECGKNGELYCRFMAVVKGECATLGGERVLGRNPLKALDEYNYCKHTREWM
jgi:hypothetical protein